MKRKLLVSITCCLLVAMLASLCVTSAAFKDVEGVNHWASSQISYMNSKGILQGDNGVTFRPNDEITKAEFVKILNHTFGLKRTTTINYSDVKTADWFYSEFQAATYYGYLTVFQNTTTKAYYTNPRKDLTREEAAALIARYLNLEAKSSYAPFTDSSSIASAYKNYVIACYEAGIITGDYNASKQLVFRPKDTLSRAEASTIIYKAAGSIYSSNTNGADTGAFAKNAVINKSGLTISNASITGTIYVTEGVENGTVSFSGCYFPGTVVVSGAATVNFSNCTIGSLVINTYSGSSANVYVSGNTKISSTTVTTPAALYNQTTAGYGFNAVNTKLGANKTLYLYGAFPSVTVSTSGSIVNMANTSTSVTSLTVESAGYNTAVTGTGTLEKITVKASGVTTTMLPKTYAISTGLTAKFASRTYSGTGSTLGDTGLTSFTVSTSNPTTGIGSNYTQLVLTAAAAERGTLYYLVYPSTYTAPTAEQIMNPSTYSYNSYTTSGYMALTTSSQSKTVNVTRKTTNYYSIAAVFVTGSGSYVKLPVYASANLGTTVAPEIRTTYSTTGLSKATATGYTRSTSNSYVTINLTPFVDGTAYVVVYPTGAQAPTAANIQSYVSHSSSYGMYNMYYNNYGTYYYTGSYSVKGGTTTPVTLYLPNGTDASYGSYNIAVQYVPSSYSVSLSPVYASLTGTQTTLALAAPVSATGFSAASGANGVTNAQYGSFKVYFTPTTTGTVSIYMTPKAYSVTGSSATGTALTTKVVSTAEVNKKVEVTVSNTASLSYDPNLYDVVILMNTTGKTYQPVTLTSPAYSAVSTGYVTATVTKVTANTVEITFNDRIYSFSGSALANNLSGLFAVMPTNSLGNGYFGGTPNVISINTKVEYTGNSTKVTLTSTQGNWVTGTSYTVALNNALRNGKNLGVYPSTLQFNGGTKLNITDVKLGGVSIVNGGVARYSGAQLTAGVSVAVTAAESSDVYNVVIKNAAGTAVSGITASGTYTVQLQPKTASAALYSPSDLFTFRVVNTDEKEKLVIGSLTVSNASKDEANANVYYVYTFGGMTFADPAVSITVSNMGITAADWHMQIIDRSTGSEVSAITKTGVYEIRAIADNAAFANSEATIIAVQFKELFGSLS